MKVLRPARKAAIVAFFAAVAAGAALLAPTAVHAQILGGAAPVITVAGSVTQDLIVEQSLTTTAPTGWQYQPNAAFISTLDQGLFSGVTSQNAAQLMPVTQGLPCNSQAVMVSVSTAAMQTYESALSDTAQQMTELQGEDFSAIAAAIQTPEVLAVLQGIGEAVLAEVQETQNLRQQLATLTTVVATNKLQELDANVRSKLPRNCD
jgi:hypothetical protein